MGFICVKWQMDYIAAKLWQYLNPESPDKPERQLHDNVRLQL